MSTLHQRLVAGETKLAIVGMGYVGMPLAIALAKHVSVIGFDGVEIGRFTVPRLTTVEQPVDEIARRSLNLLLDMMEKDAAPRHILVEASFRKRESVSRNTHT